MMFKDLSSKFYQTEYIESLAERACRETGDYCTYEVTKSQSTNSLYVTFIGSRTSAEVRLSDHKTSKNIQTVLLTKSITEDNIIRFFKNSIERVKRHQLYILLGMSSSAA